MSDSDDNLLQTPLHDLHLELGGRMVSFAGYAMPVQYPAGIMAEHRHCRESASLFDVSHMGQVRVSGAGAESALEALMPVDLAGLPEGQQRYTFFTSDSGGILDDLMVARDEDGFFLVVNAACKQQDFAHLQANLGDSAKAEMLEDKALLALQGPKAAEVLARFAPALKELPFMAIALAELGGAPCRISRSGYTGEDGYEISVPAGQAVALARQLLEQAEVMPAGLGARDSLRLEAGLCLYGHDIDESSTPVEAGLTWAIQKRRRSEGGFPGAAVIQEQLAKGADRKRVGLRPEGRAPVREGAPLVDDQGEPIGRVTSGGFGPSVEAPVAMGYLPAALAKPGTKVTASVRNKTIGMEVVKLPFHPHNYYRG